jgi:hypothetical protein
LTGGYHWMRGVRELIVELVECVRTEGRMTLHFPGSGWVDDSGTDGEYEAVGARSSVTSSRPINNDERLMTLPRAAEDSPCIFSMGSQDGIPTGSVTLLWFRSRLKCTHAGHALGPIFPMLPPHGPSLRLEQKGAGVQYGAGYWTGVRSGLVGQVCSGERSLNGMLPHVP